MLDFDEDNMNQYPLTEKCNESTTLNFTSNLKLDIFVFESLI